ncbi:MAG: RHS repeat-associated core domain-containing protein, partial [Clostridia bacterium]|nr:RHS repeat-associated core domain-containing protein [Clostridia bacterium]
MISITDKNGNTVARYSYDAWGKCTVTLDHTIAQINPFRYRGYYYDKEMHMYYLQSRYYDPMLGRFLNVYEAKFVNISKNVLLHNLFTYCKNNSVNEIDSSGQLAAQLIARIILGILIGFFAQFVVDLISYWFAKIYNNYAAFKPSVGDYVSSMISWALTCVSFSRKVIEIAASLIPILIKHVYRAFQRTFDWIDLA